MMLPHHRIAVIGLGYVGLTVAIYFSRKTNVIGFDVDQNRIAELGDGYDRHNEISKDEILASNVHFTTDETLLAAANFYIIIVPTPINPSKQPDLSKLLSATTLVGKYLKKGDIVVYESTVYPGATEELCIPELEKISKLKCVEDFSVGYSPERINPGDRVHTFENICKIVSATDPKALDIICETYLQVLNNVYRVSSIQIAEAAKVVENTQRDLNISMLNEIALILHHCNLNITEVLAAAQTKWNFLPFKPGLVGGHCIGTNSYYLIDKAKKAGYVPKFILAGQQINDDFVYFIADEAIKSLIKLDKSIKQARVGILGITYKENYPDFYDSRVIELIQRLASFELNVIAHDPLANYDAARKTYALELVTWEEFTQLDIIIFAVAHQYYCQLNIKEIKDRLKPNGIVMDIKGIFDRQKFNIHGITLWTI